MLTHDVEGARGLEQVEPLAKLESDLGFRSSFNFIPEGEYETPGELRERLRVAGFEIGVHDLKHNGKLYRSRRQFAEQAKRINGYLKEWGAEGFRSGFMLRNLPWLGDLEISYDASTFDTDPFEPQPEGAETIFPFWVPRLRDGNGYVELPYTLPQDSTVFLLLQEKTIDVWKRKIDWVAQKGGMALLNVHPDYMRFGSGLIKRDDYPSELYRDFLEYVKTTYGGRFWHALPKDVAAFAKQVKPNKPGPKKRVCMIAYSFYESDNRVRRYTESLARRGDSVEVVGLRREAIYSSPKNEHNVTVHGIQQRVHNEKSPLSYLLRVIRFCVTALLFVVRAHRKQPYNLIHVHNMPDFLVVASWIPRLLGAKVILDVHDIVPEFYGSKFKVAETSTVIRALKFIEHLSAKSVDHVIISNHLWFDKFTLRSASKEKCTVFVNHVDPKVFFRRNRNRSDRKFIILFPGGLQWHQGLDLAINAFGLIRDKIPQAEFHIYGEGNAKEELLKLVDDLDLDQRVFFFKSRSLNEIAEIIANADLGVVPKRANSFGNEAYSTKIMEFMSQGVPVVLSKTKIDSFYFTDKEVRFFESGNIQELADAIMIVFRDQVLREEMIKNSFAYVEEHSWNTKEREYLNIVDALTA